MPGKTTVNVAQELEQGLTLHQAGRLDEARAHYERALAQEPGNADGLHLLGVLSSQQGQFEQALALVQRAVSAAPDHVGYLRSLGNVLVACGRFDEAQAHFRKVLERQPGDFAALVNLGVACLQGGDAVEAAAVLAQAVRETPNSAEAHNNLGNAYDALGRADEAERAYARALEINPAMIDARFNLARLMHRDKRSAEAVRLFREVEQARPDYPQLHYNLGLALKSHGDYAAAEASYRIAIERHPRDRKAYLNLAGMLQDTARLEESIALYQQVLAFDPDYHSAYSNMLMELHFVPGLSGEDLLGAYRDWGARYADPLADEIQPHPNAREPERRLRIGMVSGGFCAHPVGHMAGPVFDHYDHATFELFCYATMEREDAITRRIKEKVEHWRPCTDMDEAQLAAQIRADGIDILLDMAGHGEGGRLLTFARKPAPVQAKWVGAQHASMGLEVMDYFITDRFETPEGHERFFDEEVVRLPDGYACLRPPAYAPQVGPLPARHNGYVTFANFNNLAKLNGPLVEVWAGLLKRVPDSRFIFKTRALRDATVRARVEALFAAHGIDAARLDLRPDSQHAELLGCYNEVDIAPDPFPFSGCMTTQEALWMGVPVVTLPGETFCANHSASHVSVVGLDELVARDVDGYLDIIAALANDLDRLDALRGGLRERMKASPLLDEVGFTRNFEHALRQMWRAWCANGSH